MTEAPTIDPDFEREFDRLDKQGQTTGAATHAETTRRTGLHLVEPIEKTRLDQGVLGATQAKGMIALAEMKSNLVTSTAERRARLEEEERLKAAAQLEEHRRLISGK